MACLDNIIGVKNDCDAISLSGLWLFDAPEISINTLANTANEKYTAGLTLAADKVRLATTLVRNDLLTYLSQSKVAPNVMDAHYNTGIFKPGIPFAAEEKYRGVVLYRNRGIKGTLRKTIIHKIKIYPLADATGVTVKIIDNYPGDGVGTETAYSFDLTAGQVNSFDVEYTLLGSYARVVMYGADVPVASCYLTCFTGCNGTLPNDCGYTKGWYDNAEISSKEGYGIMLDFSCSCDYDSLLCDMAKGVIGNIVWLKSRVLLLEEHLRSDRLSNWIIYGREETEQYKNDVENEYRTAWNTFIGSLPNTLRQYRDDCLNCQGARWATNI